MNHARANTIPLRLIEGGLVNVDRETVVRKMAADLVRFDAFRDKRASVNVLLSLGYPTLQAALYLDDARQAAMQDVVAAEMVNDA